MDNFIDPLAEATQRPKQQTGQAAFVDPTANRQPAAVPQTTSQPKNQSYASGVLDFVTQGLSMDWGDELTALEAAAFGVKPGGSTANPLDWGNYEQSFSERYRAALDAKREQQDEFSEENPVTSTVAEMGGAVLPVLLTGGAALASKSVPLGTRLLQAAGYGTAQGAITGAGASEGDLAQNAEDAAWGAGIGLVAAPTLLGAASGIQKGVSAVTRALPGGAKRQANRVLLETISPGDAATMGRKISTMPSEAVLADVAPRSARQISYSAGRNVGGANMVDDLVSRQKGQEDRLLPLIDEQFSGKGLRSTIEDLTTQRSAAAAQQYSNVYSQRIYVSDELKEILQQAGDDLPNAWRTAQKLAAREGRELPRAWDFDESGAIKFLDAVEPDVKALDYIKQALDDQVDTLFRNGRNQEALSLKGVRDRLRNFVDEKVPAYKEARSMYAGYSAALGAADKGRKYMQSALGDDLAAISSRDIKAMGAHELEAFKSGAAAVLRDRIEGKGSTADITKIFDNTKIRKKLEAAFGREQAQRFIKAVIDEAAMSETYQGILGGSPTASRMAADSAAQSSNLGLINEMATLPYNPILGSMSIANRAANGLKPPPEAVSREISNMMLNNSPDEITRVLQMLNASKRPVAGPLLSQGTAASTVGVGGHTGGHGGVILGGR